MVTAEWPPGGCLSYDSVHIIFYCVLWKKDKKQSSAASLYQRPSSSSSTCHQLYRQLRLPQWVIRHSRLCEYQLAFGSSNLPVQMLSLTRWQRTANWPIADNGSIQRNSLKRELKDAERENIVCTCGETNWRWYENRMANFIGTAAEGLHLERGIVLNSQWLFALSNQFAACAFKTVINTVRRNTLSSSKL